MRLRAPRCTAWLVFLVFLVFLGSPLALAQAAVYIKLTPSGNGYQYQVNNGTPSDNAGVSRVYLSKSSVAREGRSDSSVTPAQSSGTGNGSAGAGGAGASPNPPAAGSTVIQTAPGVSRVTVRLNSGTGSGSRYTFKSLYASPSGQPVSPQPPPAGGTPGTPPSSGNDAVAGLTADEQTLVNLINQERIRAGLPPLTVNTELVRLARLKSRDIVHNSNIFLAVFIKLDILYLL
ncbi:hypothetical protein G7K71_07255 [Desulfofundulus sp. TPOSR]|uniref:hypothetical protein n=1 Tax=Desulfofundulus sp. TPOSR TaxID=2714340 RepID=UPI00140ADB0E|nr:hypothetical protein [Desulfofundulus sp. TPOSR]NHM26781.1 hypothetical protein [Desulfofundulus sp. TPOSR]